MKTENPKLRSSPKLSAMNSGVMCAITQNGDVADMRWSAVAISGRPMVIDFLPVLRFSALNTQASRGTLDSRAADSWRESRVAALVCLFTRFCPYRHSPSLGSMDILFVGLRPARETKAVWLGGESRIDSFACAPFSMSFMERLYLSGAFFLYHTLHFLSEREMGTIL
ncbi:hypothetical protein DdX_14666 [Ditylenchus destructor]|uniref:Uncharacterized protein n=1 Tax=Ditylenchus destructor TaxID=166010 RepID=A0AAD4MWP0_9BILA|nr:hypothetical protein DdX_14666 [Ditylenchus destructor]